MDERTIEAKGLEPLRPELEAIRRRELQTTDVQKAVHQLFADSQMVQQWPRLTTSGLVEQQAWFAKLRK